MIVELDDHRRGRRAFENIPTFDPNVLEVFLALELHLGRNEVDDHALGAFGQRFSHRLAAGVLGNCLLRLGRRWLCCRPIAAQREIEQRERKLRIIFRQPLSFLTEQAALEPLDLLLQQTREFLVLVTLLLEPLNLRVKPRFDGLQSLFEGCFGHARTNADANDPCQAARELARFFFVSRSAFGTPASSRASAAASMCTEEEPPPAAGNSNTASCKRL